MNDHLNRWQAVAEAVAERMPEVDIFDTATLARRSGLSEPFVRNLLAGEPRGNPRPGNLIKLCRAVRWTDDSIARLLRGELPAPISSPYDPAAPIDGPRTILAAGMMAELHRLGELSAAHVALFDQLLSDIESLRARLDRLNPEQGEAVP